MIVRALLVWCVALATVTGAQASLRERAEEVLRARPASPEESNRLQHQLVAYADSLRAVDAVSEAARCLESAGILAFRRNELETAIDLWKRGVAWAEVADVAEAESSLLNALAIGHTVADDVDAALDVYARAIELRTSLADTLGLSRTWGNLANLYAESGRLAEALEATVTEEQWLAHVDSPRGQLANALRHAQVLMTLQRPFEARRYVDRASSLAARSARPADVGMASMRQGDLLLEKGVTVAARDSFARAVEHFERAGHVFNAAFAEQSRLVASFELGDYEACRRGARALAAALEDDGPPRLHVVALKLQAQASFALGRVEEAESVLRDALARFESQREALTDGDARVGLFVSNGELYATAARFALARGDTLGAFDLVERGRAPDFRERVRSGASVALDSLGARLRRQDAGLVVFNDPRIDPLVAFVHDGTHVRVVEFGTIDAFVEDARTVDRLLAAGEDLTVCAPILRRLGEAIARPVLDALPRSVERTYVIPPSGLVNLPFELLDYDESTVWEDRARVSLLPHAGALVGLADRPVSERGFLGVADPQASIGDEGSGVLIDSPARSAARVPLVYARREVDAIAPPGATIRTGVDATRNTTIEDLGTDPAIAHFATHAVVDAIDGARSSLVLAGEETLAAAEILDLDLRQDLVVLSGCSTFGRDRVMGEGWLGLPRAFLAAGARSVISTRWDVDDAGAQRFVEAFYAGLREGLPRDVALAAARARCRREGMPVREWAAFVLSGLANSPVRSVVAPPGRRVAWWFWVLGAGALLVLSSAAWRRSDGG